MTNLDRPPEPERAWSFRKAADGLAELADVFDAAAEQQRRDRDDELDWLGDYRGRRG